MLVGRGRISVDDPLLEWLEAAAHPRTVRVIPIMPAIAAEVASLPQSFHGDPADRLIVATCRMLAVSAPHPRQPDCSVTAGQALDAVLNDGAVLEAQPSRRPRPGEFFVVRGNHERPALTCQASNQLAEFAAAHRIERRRRLVHQEHRRIDRERAGDRHALRFAAR